MQLALITGARGAIGRHVAAQAAAAGYRVRGVGYGAWSGDADLPPVEGWINGAINAANLTALFDDGARPDLVIHLAGGSAVGPSISQPGEDFNRTVVASQNLLDWIRTAAPEARLVVASSAAVYGNQPRAQLDEACSVAPTSPYGAHKAAMEVLCRAYAHQYGLSILCLRLFSVFGPGLRKQLIWELTRRLLAGERAITLGGDGEERRDFLPIEVAASMLIQAGAHADRKTPTVNGCSGRGVTTRVLTQAIGQRFPGAEIGFSGIVRPGDPRSLVGDPTRLAQLGLAARFEFDAALDATLAWIAKDAGVATP
jgi:UDP-glucose 4-epimerase